MKTIRSLAVTTCSVVLTCQPSTAQLAQPDAPAPLPTWAAGRPAGTNDWPRQARPPAAPRLSVAPASIESPTNSPPSVALHYQPRESLPLRQIRPVPGGALADFGRLKVQFTTDAADPRPITITTPDNQTLACRASFLALYNVATGESLLLGQVTNSAGWIIPPCQAIYTNAFDSIRAHILYSCSPTNHSLSQDIILEESPVLPESFRPEDTRIEVWTAWFGPEPVSRQTQPLVLRPTSENVSAVSAPDETADWGLTKMVAGSAFGSQTPQQRLPVARSWVQAEGGVRYLVETVDYLALKASLDALARKSGSASRISPTRLDLLKSLASVPRAPKKPRPMLVGLLRRASVLECASPLALSDIPPESQSARGLAHSKTSRHFDVGIEQPVTLDLQPSTVILDFILICSIPVPADAVSWWPAGGDANDALDGNNGTAINGVTYDTGEVGQAFRFDGTSGYVEVPSSSALSPTGPFTIEGWINYDTLTGDCGDVIVAKGEDAEGAVDWALSVSPSSKLRPHLNIPGVDWFWFDCYTNLLTNTWYHVAMVYDGSNLVGYVNGADNGSLSVTGQVQSTEYSLRIGAYAPVNGDCSKAFFCGRIDELTFYSRALAPAEIEAIYNAGAAGKVNPNCVSPSTNATGWWAADGHPYDLAQTNVASLHNGVSYESGVVAQAFRFNGTSSYAEVPSSPGLLFTNAFTVEGWINYESLYGQYGSVIVAKGQDVEGPLDWAMAVSSSYNLRPQVHVPGGWCYFDCDTTLEPGGWYHVAMVYDGSNSNLTGYVNGAWDGSTEVSGAVQATGYSLRIGAYAPVNGWPGYSKCFFPGRIDELTVYNRALSDTEIAAIYSAGCAGKCKVDSDNDGLTDLQENFLGTDPNNPDTDYDGRTDAQELADGTDPLDPNSFQPARLGYWSFDNTNTWVGAQGQLPLFLTNVEGVASWDTNALEVDSTSAAALLYRDVEAGGSPNLNCRRGTVRFWFKPNWETTNAVTPAWQDPFVTRTGPQTDATLFCLGQPGASATNGCWALRISPNGSAIQFLTGGDGLAATNLQAAIQWDDRFAWHQLVLTYSPTNSSLYLDGQPVATTGLGVAHFPNATVRSNGFALGSDLAGDPLTQAKGCLDELETFNYVLTSDAIATDYDTAAALDSDGDGLTNLEEVRIPVDINNLALGMLNPYNPDTGSAGVTDDAKDSDHDALSNLGELQRYGSDPANPNSFSGTKDDSKFLFTAEFGDKGSLAELSYPSFPGGGLIRFTISDAPQDAAYDLYFIPSWLGGWQWRRIYSTTPGQTTLTLPIPDPNNGYFIILSTEDDDGDGLSNGYEAWFKYNGKRTQIDLADSDWDFLYDGWEVQYGLDPTDDAGANGRLGNPDGDAYVNYVEHDNYLWSSPSYDPLKAYGTQAPRPVVSVWATDPDADELGDTATFTIRRAVGVGGSLSSPLTVYYAVGGSATYGTDYTLNPSPAGVPRIFSATIPEGAETVDVTLLPVRDSLVEGPESVVVTLTPFGVATAPQTPDPLAWAYTVDPHLDRANITIFDVVFEGLLVNLERTAPSNYLRIKPVTDTSLLPFVNLANSGRGTVARIRVAEDPAPTDTNTWSTIVGEFYTAPDGLGRDPSRTTVDRYGNVWVGNRAEDSSGMGSVTEIGVVIGGTRGVKYPPNEPVNYTFTNNPAGEWIKPPTDGAGWYSTCPDRDGDGLIRSSSGLDPDGDLGRVLAWDNAGGADTAGGVSTALDEAVLRYVRLSPVQVRSIAVDRDNNVWVGSRANGWQEYLDGVTGLPLTGRKLNFGKAGYGALVDGYGILWSAGYESLPFYPGDGLLRFAPDSAGVPPARSGGFIPDMKRGYGIGIDPVLGDVWVGDYDNGALWRFKETGCRESVPCATEIKGIAVDGRGNVWVAHSTGQEVYHYRTTGEPIGPVTLSHPVLAGVTGNRPSGVCVDSNGMVWATCYVPADGDGKYYAMRIDPSRGDLVNGVRRGEVVEAIDLGNSATPYNYSDMTGFVSLGTTQPSGFWDFIRDSARDDTIWTRVHTVADIPANTSILVEVRAANRVAGLPSWPFHPVQPGGAMPPGISIKGRYLEVRTTLFRSFCPGGACQGPELQGLSVQWVAPAATGLGITGHPTNRVVAPNQTATFAVTATGASSYQWLKNGALVDGAISSALTFNNVQYTDAAEYSVLVSGSGHTLRSAGARLHVRGNAPEVNPVSGDLAAVTASPGGSATFSAHATATPSGTADSGYQPLFYQWRLNQTAIAGASGQCSADGVNGWLAQLTRNNLQCQDVGEYSVVFWNQYAAVSSNSALLTLSGTVPLTVSPASPISVADPSQPVTLTGTACVGWTCAQWYKDDLPISGANGLVYIITAPITCDDMGTYKLSLFDSQGTRYDASATVTAAEASLSVARVTLTAGAGTGWSYEWYFNNSSSDPPDWGEPIATNAALTIEYSSLPANRDGYYRVVATLSGQPDKSALVHLYWWPGSTLYVQTDFLASDISTLSATYVAEPLGVGPFSFAWYDPNQNLLSSTAQCTIPDIATAPAGWYWVQCTGCDWLGYAFVILTQP